VVLFFMPIFLRLIYKDSTSPISIVHTRVVKQAWEHADALLFAVITDAGHGGRSTPIIITI